MFRKCFSSFVALLIIATVIPGFAKQTTVFKGTIKGFSITTEHDYVLIKLEGQSRQIWISFDKANKLGLTTVRQISRVSDGLKMAEDLNRWEGKEVTLYCECDVKDDSCYVTSLKWAK